MGGMCCIQQSQNQIVGPPKNTKEKQLLSQVPEEGFVEKKIPSDRSESVTENNNRNAMLPKTGMGRTFSNTNGEAPKNLQDMNKPMASFVRSDSIKSFQDKRKENRTGGVNTADLVKQ